MTRLRVVASGVGRRLSASRDRRSSRGRRKSRWILRYRRFVSHESLSLTRPGRSERRGHLPGTPTAAAPASRLCARANDLSKSKQHGAEWQSPVSL